MSRKIQLEISKDDPDVAYVALPAHPGKPEKNLVKKTISVSAILPELKGASLYLDINAQDEIIGIEILL